MGRLTIEIARGRSCVEVDRDKFCSGFNENFFGIPRVIVRTSKSIDRTNHDQSPRNIESIHEPAEVGNPVAKVAGRLDVEPNRNEEED